MKKLLLLSLMVMALSACTAKDTIYRAPDESKVSARKNLTLPPDFGLCPPQTKTQK